MNQLYTRRGFTQTTVNNKVILSLTQDLQRLLLSLRNDLRGRFQIKFGMTNLYTNTAFTLIELLVVVLIIGILAAVAVPQYKLAVAKSKFVPLQVAGEAIAKSMQVYFLSNGQWPTTFNQVDALPSGNKLTRNDTAIEIGDITCFFNGDESIICYYGESVKLNNDTMEASALPLWMFVYSENQKKYCKAYTPFHKKVCQSVTGRNSSSDWYLL